MSAASIVDFESRDRPMSLSERRSSACASVPLFAFVALGLFGALRWGTMLAPAPVGRLLGLVALAGVVAGPLRALARRRRRTGVVISLVTVPAALIISGLPVTWVLGLRVSAHWIGHGLQGLPAALIPYEQADPWVPMVIVLGAGVLLLCGALTFAFAPGAGRWRATVALPLLMLVSVPSILIRPGVPYLDGLLLFALLAALAWGDHLQGTQVPGAAILVAVAGATSVALAPALDSHRAWIDVRALAATLTSSRPPESFSFDQRYGPLHWPRIGREVLDVRAARPDYWKVEDLDLFDGRGFVAGTAPDVTLPTVAPSVRARFTQTIGVTIRGLQSSQVIAAGSATAPRSLSRAIDPGLDPGTWVAASPLRPGDSYTTTTFSPQPSGAELAGAGEAYPHSALAAYRTLLLPSAQGVSAVVTPSFRGALDPEVLAGPYGRAYRLARGLAGDAATPYAFVQRVLALLRHGYRYDETPPASGLPLLSFLFRTHRGYCQHFSGAMALLLRLGGLPARVAGGFTTGIREAAGGQWIVSDLNAHDWVEVWFPHFGWVRFDPTPVDAPARASTQSTVVLPHTGEGAVLIRPRHHLELAAAVPATIHASARHSGPGTSGGLWPIGLAAGAIFLTGLFFVLRRPLTTEELVSELERALRRTRRPIAPGETLAEIEHRLRHDARAAGYVRAIRLKRYGPNQRAASADGRRALRGQLRSGLGPAARMLALWALPPRRMR